MSVRCSAGNDPSLCCLPGAWERVDFYRNGEPLDTAVIDVAAGRGIDPHALNRHVGAVHGWESHDTGYADAVAAAADCLVAGGCGPRATSDV